MFALQRIADSHSDIGPVRQVSPADMAFGRHSPSICRINVPNPDVVSTAGRHPSLIKAEASATNGPATRL